jgi:hypothetical protein
MSKTSKTDKGLWHALGAPRRAGNPHLPRLAPGPALWPRLVELVPPLTSRRYAHPLWLSPSPRQSHEENWIIPPGNGGIQRQGCDPDPIHGTWIPAQIRRERIWTRMARSEWRAQASAATEAAKRAPWKGRPIHAGKMRVFRDIFGLRRIWQASCDCPAPSPNRVKPPHQRAQFGRYTKNFLLGEGDEGTQGLFCTRQRCQVAPSTWAMAAFNPA